MGGGQHDRERVLVHLDRRAGGVGVQLQRVAVRTMVTNVRS
ncbi:hypothetical protein [Actinomadura sp. BRA 177]|nr:hypothetical protein [Actinomadura sp. BRA 177]